MHVIIKAASNPVQMQRDHSASVREDSGSCTDGEKRSGRMFETVPRYSMHRRKLPALASD
jgi:hypothetical protein